MKQLLAILLRRVHQDADEWWEVSVSQLDKSDTPTERRFLFVCGVVRDYTMRLIKYYGGESDDASGPPAP